MIERTLLQQRVENLPRVAEMMRQMYIDNPKKAGAVLSGFLIKPEIGDIEISDDTYEEYVKLRLGLDETGNASNLLMEEVRLWEPMLLKEVVAFMKEFGWSDPVALEGALIYLTLVIIEVNKGQQNGVSRN